MFELTTFNNSQFGTVRTVEIDCEPWLVGKDVAEILGFKNPRQAIASNVDDEDRGVHEVDTPSGVQNMTVINEKEGREDYSSRPFSRSFSTNHRIYSDTFIPCA